jgi:hypothetical protein
MDIIPWIADGFSLDSQVENKNGRRDPDRSRQRKDLLMNETSTNPNDRVSLTKKAVNKTVGRMQGVKNLDKVLKVFEKLDFPNNPTQDDFFDDDHLLGMQLLELSITFLLRSRRVLNQDDYFDLLGKFKLSNVLNTDRLSRKEFYMEVSTKQ